MSTHYKKFLRLLENWPIDPTKPGRDLGEYLRKQLKQSLRAGSLSLEHEGGASVERQFEALERISSNIHFNKYPRKLNSTACGLSAEQCTILLSEEALKFFENKKQGLFARFVQRDN